MSICVLIKDPHSQSFSQTMEGYLEAIVHKILTITRDSGIETGLKMIRLGYFLFTINPNSKFNKIKNNMRYVAVTMP
jgi:hypothetical protein